MPLRPRLRLAPQNNTLLLRFGFQASDCLLPHAKAALFPRFQYSRLGSLQVRIKRHFQLCGLILHSCRSVLFHSRSSGSLYTYGMLWSRATNQTNRDNAGQKAFRWQSGRCPKRCLLMQLVMTHSCAQKTICARGTACKAFQLHPYSPTVPLSLCRQALPCSSLSHSFPIVFITLLSTFSSP